MTETPLDLAHRAMTAAPTDDDARLGYFARLAATELVLLLETEALGETLDPRVVIVDDTTFALAFDGAERLAAFTGTPAPYAALSGRVLAEMLASAGVGLGINLGGEGAETLLPPEALAWMVTALGAPPAAHAGAVAAVAAPGPAAAPLLAALEGRLAAAAGLAECAYLATLTHRDGSQSLLLALVNAVTDAEGALRRVFGGAIALSGTTQAVDLAFLSTGDPLLARVARVGLRIDLPETPGATPPAPPSPPGFDPARPPKLR